MAQDKKRQQIVEAAQKRFAHFGVNKTTMNEIADDLGISKASLYYYFPDKLSIYAAVLQHIVEKEENNSHAFLHEKDPLKAFALYLDNRTRFINNYYNILEYLNSLNRDIPKELEPVFTIARTREIKFITLVIENGISTGKLEVSDPAETAELLHDALEGLRKNAFEQKSFFDVDKKTYQTLLKREKRFSEIFFKGMSN